MESNVPVLTSVDATEALEAHKLPSVFSYRTAFLLGAEYQLREATKWLDAPCEEHYFLGLKTLGRLFSKPIKRHECSKCRERLLSG